MWMAHGPTSRVFNNADGTRSNIKSLLNIHPIIQPPKHPHTSTATHAKQDADPSHNYVRPSDSLSFQKNTIDTCSSLKSQTADEGFEKYARTYIPMQPIVHSHAANILLSFTAKRGYRSTHNLFYFFFFFVFSF